jgi:hypothetical protein
MSGNRGSRGGSLPRVTPIVKGEVLAVYPDDAMIEAMRSEGWGKVKTGFRRNGEGELTELFVFKSTDGTGLAFRFYRSQRPHIHVLMSGFGRVVGKPNAGPCTVRRVTADGRDAFVFDIADQISLTNEQD